LIFLKLILMGVVLVVVQGGEDKSIDGMIARLLAPGDCLSLAPEELFLCARVCVVGLISTRRLLSHYLSACPS
jgi:hypothetical protein